LNEGKHDRSAGRGRAHLSGPARRVRELPRLYRSALAARTLAEIFQERLFDGARMQDISVREKAGDSPGLIINTTLYNNGRRLALTTLPTAAFEYDFFADLERSLRERGRSGRVME
jgi:hypothetical protein